MNNRPMLAHRCDFMGRAGAPPVVLFARNEMDMWPYRPRTTALLKRYARSSVEIGRLPSLLGREFFRSRVTSYSMGTFEDIAIFVTDMESALEKLASLEKTLLTLNVLEEYSISEAARLMHCPQRTAERLLQEAIDRLSVILLDAGLLVEIPS